MAPDEIKRFVREAFSTADLDGKRVCLVVPDGTRTCPLPLLMRAVHGALHGRVSRLTVLVALGTHVAMGEEAWQMLGGDSGNVLAVRPLREGTMTEFDVTQRMLAIVFSRVGVMRFPKPRVLVCVPPSASGVERRAIERAIRYAGGRQVVPVEEPLAVHGIEGDRREQIRQRVVGEGFVRIEDVERLSGLELRIPEEALQPLEAGSFYHHQLIGCRVELTDGTVVGVVSATDPDAGDNLADVIVAASNPPPTISGVTPAPLVFLSAAKKPSQVCSDAGSTPALSSSPLL